MRRRKRLRAEARRSRQSRRRGEVLSIEPSTIVPELSSDETSAGCSAAQSDGLTGLVGLAARLVLHAADMEVWDEARQHAVKQILEGRCVIRGVKDLPPFLLSQALKPKGYEASPSSELHIGSGSFGRVIKVRRCSDGRLFAVKRQLLGDEAADVVPVLRETSILNALKGASNVVQIEDAFLVRPSSDGAEVWTVLEYFPLDLHRASHRFRSEDSARLAIFQILLGLRALHSADIIHRDLKPENLLVDLGRRPPFTARIVLCDFGMSRSVHLEKTSERPRAPRDLSPTSRLVSDRVTSCWWRAPEMWGWADTRQMTKRDLKSLDIFALGLVWAQLLTRKNVITHEEGVDPPKFRLLEILQKVDRPSPSELLELGFGEDVAKFVRQVLAGDVEAIREEVTGSSSEKRGDREKVLEEPYIGIREWVRRFQAIVSPSAPSESPTLALIEAATRFSYRRRPSVGTLLKNHFFADLQAETPRWSLSSRQTQTSPLGDVRFMLEVEQQRQSRAAQTAQELTADFGAVFASGKSTPEIAFMRRVASKATAQIEESVRAVCDRVRAELVEAKRS